MNKYLFVTTLLISLLTNDLWSTSNHTINIDGSNDFVADETFSGTSGSTWYFTWDDTNFYFAIDASDVNSGDGNKWVHLYIDTDPNDPITGGNGSTSGVTYNTQQPTLAFSSNYHFRWKADNSYTNMLDYNDGTGSWTDDNTGSGNFGIQAFQSGTFVEFSIPRASLGSPNNIHVSGAMINEAGGGEFTFFAFPSINSEGYDANHDNWYGFHLSENQSPNNPVNLNENLPVELISFDGRSTANGNRLNWETGAEFNTNIFEVLRSKSGKNDWQSIGSVKSGGNTLVGRKYTFEDRVPLTHNNFYKLMIIDHDGYVEYSPIVNIYNRYDYEVHISPNPVKSILHVEGSEEATYTLLNSTGQRLQTHIDCNQNKCTMDFSNYVAGLYYLSIVYSNGEIDVKKIIKH